MRNPTLWLAALTGFALVGCQQTSTTEKTSTTTGASAAASSSGAPVTTSGATEGRERTLPGDRKSVV